MIEQKSKLLYNNNHEKTIRQKPNHIINLRVFTTDFRSTIPTPRHKKTQRGRDLLQQKTI